MRKAIWLGCALVLACSGSSGGAFLEGDGGLSGVRVGRGAGSDARPADVRSMLAPDLAVAVDALAADVLAADSAVPVDVAMPADVARVADVAPEVGRDAVPMEAAPDARPWGNRDDAGALHCPSMRPTGSVRCGFDFYDGVNSATCRKDARGDLPVPCRWGAEGEKSWAWYVNTCSDCAGLEAWDGGVL